MQYPSLSYTSFHLASKDSIQEPINIIISLHPEKLCDYYDYRNRLIVKYLSIIIIIRLIIAHENLLYA